MEIIKPKKLKTGDTIGILAVSGRIREYERIEYAAEYFEKSGYKTVISDTCRTNHRYSAGKSDDECIDALHNFFLDKSIDAVICARGGFGALKLLDKIDWNIIKENPKIFAGYSDITVLLTMIYKKTGLITFHSPMANGDFGKADEIEDYTAEIFFKTLEGKINEIKADNLRVYKSGCAEGALFGGNLASLASLCGRSFVPDKDIILFLEDLNEPVYKIDRMLAQLSGVKELRNNVKGIVFGGFINTDDENMLEEVLFEFAEKMEAPAAGGFKITHNKLKDTVPFGIHAIFNAEEGTVKFSAPVI